MAKRQKKEKPIQITAHVPITVSIPESQVDKLCEMHVQHWADSFNVHLEDGCPASDLVLQAIKAGLVDENQLGGDWAKVDFEETDFHHSSCGKEKKAKP